MAASFAVVASVQWSRAWESSAHTIQTSAGGVVWAAGADGAAEGIAGSASPRSRASATSACQAMNSRRPMSGRALTASRSAWFRSWCPAE
ncbi:hypothetical protein [Streptomyces sp. NPDC017941]|uniref:hypothetical protein n=1 Tax=Streptomyces sp. NPDC017941 TaxID=3365018 RepID=UPI0037876EA3